MPGGNRAVIGTEFAGTGAQGMPIEIEQKFRLPDRMDFTRRLESAGGIASGRDFQTDHYYSHPARDFGRSDEALRIRTDGTGSRLCWKGPRAAGPVKIREELEIPFAGDFAAVLAALLERLGFTFLATVRKSRETWLLPAEPSGGARITVTLDRVEGLGEFAELELVLESGERNSADRESAGAGIASLAARLGLENPESRSYLEMLAGTRPIEAPDRL